MKKSTVHTTSVSPSTKRTPSKTTIKQTNGLWQSPTWGEDFYQQVLNSLEDYAVFVIDLEGRVKWWNAGAERLLGYREKEILGQNAAILFTKDDQTQGRPSQEMLLAEEKGRAVDERFHVRKDGSEFWASGLLFPCKDEKGHITGYTKILRDLTRRRRQEERFRMMIERSMDGIVLTNGKGECVYASPAIERITGYSLEEFVRIPNRDLIHPDDVSMLDERFGDLAGQPGKSATVRVRFRRKDESWGWAEITATNLLHDPSVEAVVSNIRDISEEQADHLEAARLAAIVSSSDDVIVGKTLGGIIMSWNKAAERLFGYTADEAVGQHITLIIPPELHSQEDEILDKISQGETIHHFDTVRRAKDGTLVDVSLSISPVRDKTGRIVGESKIARDVRERKRLERQKEGFLGITSHELKTPVTSLKGYTQVLEKRLRRGGDEESAQLLAKMDGQLNKLTNLIDDLLDVTKIEAGNAQFTLEVFDFSAAVEEVVEQLQLTTNRHTLVTEMHTDCQVRADKKRIGQVLTNFLSNAIKYSPHNRKIIIRSEEREGMVVLSVQDFGVGISAKNQDKVFERFYRVSGPREDTFPGLGLGLYISAQIIKSQGGRIWVESTEGKGSTFYFSLPIHHKN